jgi:peptidoglycan/LPS O-acetylase OafA/YrhL
MDYRREIDGLRALAILPVMLFHAGFTTFSGGFVGVDVFFVISGYLITKIILADLEQGKFSFVNFYERRARRILPALYFIMFVCIPFAWFWLLPTDMKEFSQSLVAVPVFASNILFWSESGYFDTAAELKPLIHTWSLAVEEQYYVLFPLFLMLFWKLGKRRLLYILGLVFAASLALAQWAAYSEPAAAFYLLPTRTWELLIGVFAAFFLSQAKRKEFSKRSSDFAGWLGITLILYAIFNYSKTTPFPALYALVPTLGTVLIILFSNQQTTSGKFLGSKVFVQIGLVSYSAYLWHQPLFAFFRHSGFERSKGVYFLLGLLTLAFAYMTWTYIEAPFRKRRKYRRRTIFTFCLLGGAFFVSFGWYGNQTNGFDKRTGMVIFKDLTYDTSKLGYRQCDDPVTSKEPELNYCMSSSSAPNAWIIGDSHADDKFYGIEKSVQSYSWKLVGNSSCPPLMGVKVKSIDGTECTEKLEKLFAHIDSYPHIKIVVLSFAHMYPLDKLIAADHIEKKFDPKDAVFVDSSNPNLNKVDTFYLGLRRTIKFLKHRNIKTVIALDIPELQYLPANCLKKRASCDFSKRDVLRRQEVLRRNVLELSSDSKGIFVFDPLDLFCPANTDKCSILLNGRSVYRDSHHLTHYGSLKYGELFSKWLSQKLN